jgi:hypothetical protein
MSRFRMVVVFALAALLAVTLSAGVAGKASAAPDTMSSNTHANSTLVSMNTSTGLSWAEIQQAIPYVTRLANGNYQVDPRIQTVFSAQQVRQVVTSVSTYNALPMSHRVGLSYRQAPGAKSGPTPFLQGGGSGNGCSYYWNENAYWWGTEFYLNECVVEFSRSIANFSKDTIAAILFGTVITTQWVALAVAAAVVVYAAVLFADDEQCGYRGVYLDQPWGTPVYYPRGAC